MRRDTAHGGLIASILTAACAAVGTAAQKISQVGVEWTLVGEDGNAKQLVPAPLAELLTENETQAIDLYDSIFEKYSMYCNGRWLGAQVLQDAQDLMYLQHMLYVVRPSVVVETGTYKGGLTYFFATLMDSLGIDGKVLSVDRNPPDRVFGAAWFCPVCEECVRVWETPAWERHVEFFQGWADNRELYRALRAQVLALASSGPVLVNLDACHEYDCVFVEIMLYAPLVSVGSYLVVQDAKLDRLWGKPAVSAAVARFLEGPGAVDFVRDRTVPFYGYSQHVYLRRVSSTMGHIDEANWPESQ